MDTFTPVVKPSESSSRATTFSTYTSEFGSGYSQRVATGINSERRTLSLAWSALTNADAQSIRAWLESKLGAEAFLYELESEPGLPRKWICPEVSEVYFDQLGASLTANLTEVRDL